MEAYPRLHQRSLRSVVSTRESENTGGREFSEFPMERRTVLRSTGREQGAGGGRPASSAGNFGWGRSVRYGAEVRSARAGEFTSLPRKEDQSYER